MAHRTIDTQSQNENSKTIAQPGQPSTPKVQTGRPQFRMEELEARMAPCNPVHGGC